MEQNNTINAIVQRHVGYSAFIASVPIIFFMIISFFAHDKEMLWGVMLCSPLIAVGACAILLKNVLTEVEQQKQRGHRQ